MWEARCHFSPIIPHPAPKTHRAAKTRLDLPAHPLPLLGRTKEQQTEREVQPYQISFTSYGMVPMLRTALPVWATAVWSGQQQPGL